MTWRKSSHSAGVGECVEAGDGAGVISVRDSALDESPVLRFTPAAWRAVVSALKDEPGRS